MLKKREEKQKKGYNSLRGQLCTMIIATKLDQVMARLEKKEKNPEKQNSQ